MKLNKLEFVKEWWTLCKNNFSTALMWNLWWWINMKIFWQMMMAEVSWLYHDWQLLTTEQFILLQTFTQIHNGPKFSCCIGFHLEYTKVLSRKQNLVFLYLFSVFKQMFFLLQFSMLGPVCHGCIYTAQHLIYCQSSPGSKCNIYHQ